MKQTGASNTTHRLGCWIIPAKVALGLVLLNAALLMAGTLHGCLSEHSGFNAGNAVLAELELSNAGITQKDTRVRALDYLHQVEGASGVEPAALMSMAPMNNGSFSVGEYYTRDSEGGLHVNQQIWPESISRGYLKVMGTRIVKGVSLKPQTFRVAGFAF